jgi:hypothetical protein
LVLSAGSIAVLFTVHSDSGGLGKPYPVACVECDACRFKGFADGSPLAAEHVAAWRSKSVTVRGSAIVLRIYAGFM